jgi:hypothetical protein
MPGLKAFRDICTWILKIPENINFLNSLIMKKTDFIRALIRIPCSQINRKTQHQSTGESVSFYCINLKKQHL